MGDNQSKKKSLYANMSKKQKLVFCRISATSPDSNEIASPCPSCIELLQDGTTSNLSTHVTDALKSAGAKGSWQHGHLTRLAQKGLLWPSDIDPKGLTFSAIIPIPGHHSKESQKDVSVSVKASWENNLAQDEVDFMVRQDFFFPMTIYEFEIQLFTYIAMVGILAGTQSFIYQRLSSWIHHYRANHTAYSSQADEKNLWLTCTVQVLLYSARSGSPQLYR
jgi:hypothetical protein